MKRSWVVRFFGIIVAITIMGPLKAPAATDTLPDPAMVANMGQNAASATQHLINQVRTYRDTCATCSSYSETLSVMEQTVGGMVPAVITAIGCSPLSAKTGNVIVLDGTGEKTQTNLSPGVSGTPSYSHIFDSTVAPHVPGIMVVITRDGKISPPVFSAYPGQAVSMVVMNSYSMSELIIWDSSSLKAIPFSLTPNQGECMTFNAPGVAGQYHFYSDLSSQKANGMEGTMIVSTVTPPAPPSLATPSNAAINIPKTPSVSWNSVTGATSYGIQVSESSTFTTVITNPTGLTTLSTIIGGLANSLTYFWRANAANVGGPGAWSEAWRFTTIMSAPPVPSLLSPTNNAINQPIVSTLSWSSAVGVSGYSLQVSTTTDFSTTVMNQSGLSISGLTVGPFSYNTTYCWRANAMNIGGTSGWSDAWKYTTILQAPVLSSPTNNATGVALSPVISWGSVSGASSYTYQVSTASDFLFFSQGSVGKTSQSLSGLSANEKCYWRVNAANSSGSSAWSGIWSFSVGTTASMLLSNSVINGPSFHIKDEIMAYSLDRQYPVAIRIYDILGKKLFEFNRLQSSGSYSLSVKSPNLPSRFYFVHFKAGNFERRIAVIGK